MRRFRFRLAAIERLAEARERSARQELADREGKRAQAELARGAAEATAAEARRRFAEGWEKGAVSRATILSALRVVDDAGRLAIMAARSVQRCTQAADAAADALRARMVERKGLQAIRRRQLSRHAVELSRFEQKEADDAAHRKQARRP